MSRKILALAPVLVVLLIVPLFAVAQDPVKTNPGKYVVVFENERVRVLEYRDRPGDKSLMHEHPDSVVYNVAPAKRRFSFPDGKTVDAELKGGQVIWNNAGKHGGENTGTTDTHAIIVELKQPAR
jgi:beta-alanine degradation protein BauB